MQDLTLYNFKNVGLYITTPDQENSTRFIYVKDSQPFPDTITLSEAFTTNVGSFCFFNTITIDDLIAFNDSVRQGILQRMQASGPGRYFFWIESVDTTTKSLAVSFYFEATAPTPTQAANMVLIPQGFPAINFLQPNSQLVMQSGGTIGLNSDQTGFSISNSGKSELMRFVQQFTPKSEMDVEVKGLDLPLADGLEGMIEFNVALSEDNLTNLDIGLRYFWEEEGQTTIYSGRYPVFELPTSGTLSLRANMDNYRLTDSERNYFGFLPASVYGTYFRSLLGRQIGLQPATANVDTPPRLNLSSLPAAFNSSKNPIYWTLSGDFLANIANIPDDGDEQFQQKWLCGLSGTEYISINLGQSPPTTGGLFRFVDGQAAFSQFTISTSTTTEEERPSFGALQNDYTSSRIILLPGSTGTAQWYYSEPADSPFFQKTAEDESDLILDFLGLSEAELPATASTDDTGFPAVPYADFQLTGDDPPFSAIDLASNFETQILNPLRKEAIIGAVELPEATAAAKSLTIETNDDAVNGFALTPQGYVSNFDSGNWNQLRFAGITPEQNPDLSEPVYLKFQAAEGQSALPQALQTAFLTNQQFLVISVDNGNLGDMTAQLELSGWNFALKPPATQTLGDYENVIIFKSALGTITDFAASPSNWTSYSDFNDTTFDPQGQYLSDWLVDYLETAKELYDGGQGNIEFENFVQIIEDPNWSGFLILKVAIPPDLPEEIRALTAGIDPSRFFAHHLGNQITQAKPDEDTPDLGYSQQSSVFALVNYLDPIYEQLIKEGKDEPLIQTSTAEYDFTVLSLLVSFENSVLKTFSSKLMLLINNLFQNLVLRSSPIENEEATNRLILNGSVQQRNGVATYIFATPQGSVSRFFIDSRALETVRVDRAEFTVQSSSTSGTGNNEYETFATQFTLFGALAFSQGLAIEDQPLFDLFSYQALSYTNLAIDMSFKAPAGDNTSTAVEDRQFVFNSSSININPQAVKIVAADDENLESGFNYARQGSILAQFPMKLKRFIQSTNTSPISPTSLGFNVLSVPTLTRFGVNTSLSDTSLWYGFEFSLDMGGMGALANNTVFTADLLFGWDPQANNWYVGLKLPGLGPLDKLLDIEGVINFGAQDILLDRVETTANGVTVYQFVLKFSSIGLSILSFSFPAKGSTNLLLFGDPTEEGTDPPTTLGWFGSYVQPGLSNAE